MSNFALNIIAWTFPKTGQQPLLLSGTIVQWLISLFELIVRWLHDGENMLWSHVIRVQMEWLCTHVPLVASAQAHNTHYAKIIRRLFSQLPSYYQGIIVPQLINVYLINVKLVSARGRHHLHSLIRAQLIQLVMLDIHVNRLDACLWNSLEMYFYFYILVYSLLGLHTC